MRAGKMRAMSVTSPQVTSNRLRSRAVCDFQPLRTRAQPDKTPTPPPPPSATGNCVNKRKKERKKEKNTSKHCLSVRVHTVFITHTQKKKFRLVRNFLQNKRGAQWEGIRTARAIKERSNPETFCFKMRVNIFSLVYLSMPADGEAPYSHESNGRNKSLK